jgi:L-histidine N-alpha-methyltransferase
MSSAKPGRILTQVLSDEQSDFAQDIHEGLTAASKWLSCRHIYDARGSDLFERICAQPEYYLTDAELEILGARMGEIAGMFTADSTVVELGSGSAVKATVVADAWIKRHSALRYMPIDTSQSALQHAAEELTADHPKIDVTPYCGDYVEGLRFMSENVEGAACIMWLGSSIGNMPRAAAATFMASVRRAMRDHDRLLVGVDLRKEREMLERAYDDAAGVSRAFSENILHRINDEFGADFDLAQFEYEAQYDERLGVVRMNQVSTVEQTVTINELDLVIKFDAGERIHVEDSHKYAPAEIAALAATSGFSVERQWLDERQLFSLNVLSPADHRDKKGALEAE